MPRSFTSPFSSRSLEAHQRPYLVLEINWATNDQRFYIDRETDTFAASGTRIPTVEDSLVVDWGQLRQTLTEQRAGTVEKVTVKLEDRDGELSGLLDTLQQNRTVKIWRMYDAADVVWQTDAALVFVGTVKPHAYTQTDNVIAIELEDPSRQLLGKSELLATRAIFPTIPQDYEDRNIPLCWGQVERVEAVLIDGPWSVGVLGLASGINAPGMQLALDGHPDEFGAAINTEMTVYVGSAGQKIKGKFLLSPDKANKPSRFKVTGLDGVGTIDASIASVASPGTSVAVGTFYSDDPEVHGAYTSVIQDGVWRCSDTSITSLGGSAYSITWDDSTINENMEVGQSIKLHYRRPIGTVDSLEDLGDSKRCVVVRDDVTPANYSGGFNSTPNVQVYLSGSYRTMAATLDVGADEVAVTFTYPEGDETAIGYYEAITVGTPIRFGRDNPDWDLEPGAVLTPVNYPYVYAVNGLPSRGIIKVEGYGRTGSGSSDAEGFILIGEQERIIDDVITITSEAWTENLADDSWRAELGNNRDITTITFDEAPQRYSTRLTSNRIWVTLKGTTTALYGYATSPAHVMLTYLRHPSLLAVDDALIDLTSFTATLTVLELGNRRVSFAQTESQDALTLLHDIVRQCRSIIVYDSGKFAWRLLQNTPYGWEATFDEASILENSLEVRETDSNDLVTRLVGKWRYKWDEFTEPRKRAAVNAGAEAEFPIKSQEVDIWLYSDPAHVADELGFWLTRWSRIYREVTFQTFGRALVLQPADWIKVGYTDGTGREIIPDGTLCEVLEIKDDPQTGLIDVKCRYPKFEF